MQAQESGHQEHAGVVTEPIAPGYRVFAHHIDAAHHADAGQFVGVVERVLERRGVHYLQVRGGLERANELFLPLAAVRFVGSKQVHLRLSVEDLTGQAWHLPPAPTPT